MVKTFARLTGAALVFVSLAVSPAGSNNTEKRSSTAVATQLISAKFLDDSQVIFAPRAGDALAVCVDLFGTKSQPDLRKHEVCKSDDGVRVVRNVRKARQTRGQKLVTLTRRKSRFKNRLYKRIHSEKPRGYWVDQLIRR